MKEKVTLSEQGVSVGTTLILPIAFEAVDILYDHSKDATAPKITCRYHLRDLATPITHRFECCYDPDKPCACLSQLDKLGIKILDRATTLAVLNELFHSFFSVPLLPGGTPVRHDHSADRSGWLRAGDGWIYLTSGYGIYRDGIDRDWHCTAPNACLDYDPDLSAADAYLRVLRLLDIDFRFAAPIFTSAILSTMRPLRDMVIDKSIPGLLISGPTGCGKSKLAICLTHILTGERGLERVFLLHEPEKDLKKDTRALADTTFILDDVRRTPAPGTKYRIHTTLDTFVRDQFSSGRLLTVATGESDALEKMIPSLMNRCIEIRLDRSPDHIKDLQKLLSQFYEEPKVVRTFFRHFIQFLAGYLERKGNKLHFRDLEERFNAMMPGFGSPSRERDNLSFSYWAFDIFIRYGKDLGVLDADRAKDLTDRYGDILQGIAQHQDLRDPETWASRLLSLIAKRMRIRLAERIERSDRDRSFSTWQEEEFSGTYGYCAVIDHENHFSGVLIEDTTLLYGYPGNFPSKTLLILEHEEMEHHFLAIRDERLEMGDTCLYRSFHQFLNALRERHILLTEPRHEKDPLSANLLIDNYPIYGDHKVLKGKVHVFCLETGLKDTIKAICHPDRMDPWMPLVSTTTVGHCAARLKCLI